MLSGVYKITNRLNDKFYVGSSNDIKPRWMKHRRDAAKNIPPYKCLLHDAIRKYGLENFLFEVIEECGPDRDLLLEREQHYLDTLRPEYNICKIAGSPASGEPWNKGLPINEATRQRLIKQGFRPDHRPWNKGTTGLMPEPWNKGVEPSPEMLAQLIEVGFQPGMETWNKGMIMSEEHCQRMSEIAKANFDPDHQAKMTEAARIANIGRKHSKERCDAISQGNLNSDARKAYAETRRGVARSDELKQKVSEGIKSSVKFQASLRRRVGKKRADNTSGHYGIVWDKSREKWLVRVNKQQIGRFATLEEAIQRRPDPRTSIPRSMAPSSLMCKTSMLGYRHGSRLCLRHHKREPLR